MKSDRSQRKLSNIRLTREFHFRHLGLWMLVVASLIVLLNYLLYLLVMDQWGYVTEAGLAAQQGGSSFQRGLIIGLAIEAFVFCLAVVYLGCVTSHRIAGAYIRLQNVCNSIRDGDLQTRLKFRDYDHLEHVEKAFNEMMDALTKGQ